MSDDNTLCRAAPTRPVSVSSYGPPVGRRPCVEARVSYVARQRYCVPQVTTSIAGVAALIGDVVTACPAICDARPSLLTDLTSIDAAMPAAARCMRAYLAQMSAEALHAALAGLQHESSGGQVIYFCRL